MSKGPEVWSVLKWVSHPSIWRDWKTWKLFLRISCSYDSGYKLGFSKSCTWFERWKWGSGLLPVISGVTLERSWLSAVVPLCSLASRGCFGVWWLLLPGNSIHNSYLSGATPAPYIATNTPHFVFLGTSPCLLGAPKLAHTLVLDAFIELSSITLQGHYLLPDRNWPEKKWLTEVGDEESSRLRGQRCKVNGSKEQRAFEELRKSEYGGSQLG